MPGPNNFPVDVWTIPVYFGIAFLLTAAIIVISSVLGEKGKRRNEQRPYESGINATGSARLRFNAQFYVVAMIFLVFDVETVFVVTWAVGGKRLGWAGYFEIALFIILLLATLLYVARIGALDWRRRKVETGRQK
ncbi:MAG TPA: NADH-quinone oxidoreductase subunit A [Spirochaetia bacterium]|nr:NADH-quinone oxidoreductase subunit A [Spirochaetia bacterium]